MALLTLITHAHTAQNPATDAVTWALSATGQMQAVALTRQPFWSQVDRILVSSEPKTRLTVLPLLAQRKLPVQAYSHFNEALRPGWVEEYAAAVQRFFAHPTRSIDGWESAADALHRFCDGIDAHIDPTADEHVALVAHGLVLSLYRAHLLGLSCARLDAWRQLRFAAVAHVDLRGPTLVQDFTAVIPSSPRA